MIPEITFCTVVMNRLEHLKYTLCSNIENNKFSNVEFLILDYNSTDGCQDWILSTFKKEILSGIVSYYKTNQPSSFHRSHSKNMAFRLAKANLICNMDADNFSGPNFARYILNTFSKNNNINNIFITTTSRRFDSNKKKHLLTGDTDVIGRIVIKKNDFLAVGGYDERFISYGFEDFDLINRLELNGLIRITIKKPAFLKAIKHPNFIRISNPYSKFNLFGLFIYQVNFYTSICLFLFSNHTFNCGTVTDNKTKDCEDIKNIGEINREKYTYSLEEKEWQKGTWKINNKTLDIFIDNILIKSFQVTNKKLKKLTYGKIDHECFYKVESKDLINELLIFRETIENRYLMHDNITKNIIEVNAGVGGSGIIFKNYDNINPIYI